MNRAEVEASAETELREAVLSEFLKTDLPAPVTLLRHCERYLVKAFDARAACEFDRIMREEMPADQYSGYLRNLERGLPVYFFGCQYEPTVRGLEPAGAAPGCPWGRCVEYAMLARVDHGAEPRLTENDILQYLGINGHLFVSYALETRATYWRSRAYDEMRFEGTVGAEAARATEGGFPKPDQAGATEAGEGESNRTEAGPPVNGTNPAASGGEGRKRGPKSDHETASRVAEIVARVAPDGDWRPRLDDICEALDQAQIPFPPRWRKRDRSCDGWAAFNERANAVKAIEYRLKLAKARKKTTPETLS